MQTTYVVECPFKVSIGLAHFVKILNPNAKVKIVRGRITVTEELPETTAPNPKEINHV